MESKILFGEHHKVVLAHLAGVNKRTVQRWMSGEQPMPDWVIERLNETMEIWRNDYERII